MAAVVPPTTMVVPRARVIRCVPIVSAEFHSLIMRQTVSHGAVVTALVKHIPGRLIANGKGFVFNRVLHLVTPPHVDDKSVASGACQGVQLVVPDPRVTVTVVETGFHV